MTHLPVTLTAVHVDYPHVPGYLIDCPACEGACHCEEGSAPCVATEHDDDGTYGPEDRAELEGDMREGLALGWLESDVWDAGWEA